MTNQKNSKNSNLQAMQAKQAKSSFSKPVVLTNLTTSECLTFSSINEAATHLGLGRNTLINYLTNDEVLCIEENCYKARWKNVFQGFNPIVMLKDGEYLVFESTKEAAEYFKCGKPTFYRSSYKGWQIFRLQDLTPSMITKLYRKGLLKDISHLITDAEGNIRLDYFQKGI